MTYQRPIEACALAATIPWASPLLFACPIQNIGCACFGSWDTYLAALRDDCRCDRSASGQSLVVAQWVRDTSAANRSAGTSTHDRNHGKKQSWPRLDG